MKLANKIEAVLFFKDEPISVDTLSKILSVSKEEISSALTELRELSMDKGVVLIEHDGLYTLGTHSEMGEIIESIQKEDLNKALSKASLETLSIILYKNGASRAEIDYIRGVNSGFTLRALSVRGLVEKVTDPEDARKYVYKPTLELLSYMGVANIKDLPDFEKVNLKIDQIKEEKTIENNTENNAE